VRPFIAYTEDTIIVIVLVPIIPNNALQEITYHICFAPLRCLAVRREEACAMEGWGVIYTYTREQAIEDGQLLDVSETPEAKEAGFRVPVCLTVGVHALLQVPELLSGWQDYGGRLWDTLFLAAAAFKREGEKSLVPFEVVYQTDPRRSAAVTLWLLLFGV